MHPSHQVSHSMHPNEKISTMATLLHQLKLHFLPPRTIIGVKGRTPTLCVHAIVKTAFDSPE